jgi:hypothetical protein
MTVPEAVPAAMREKNELFSAEVVKKNNMNVLDEYTQSTHEFPPLEEILFRVVMQLSFSGSRPSLVLV